MEKANGSVKVRSGIKSTNVSLLMTATYNCFCASSSHQLWYLLGKFLVLLHVKKTTATTGHRCRTGQTPSYR